MRKTRQRTIDEKGITLIDIVLTTFCDPQRSSLTYKVRLPARSYGVLMQSEDVQKLLDAPEPHNTVIATNTAQGMRITTMRLDRPGLQLFLACFEGVVDRPENPGSGRRPQVIHQATTYLERTRPRSR